MHFQHLEFLPISQDDVGHVSFSAPVLNSSGKCAGLQQIVEGLSEAESFGRRVLGHEMTCWLQMRGSWNSGTPWYPKLSSISIVFSSNYPATKGYPMTMEPEEFLRNRNFFDAPWLCRNRISSRFTEENFDCFMKTTNDCWTQLSKKHEIRGSFTFFFFRRDLRTKWFTLVYNCKGLILAQWHHLDYQRWVSFSPMVRFSVPQVLHVKGMNKSLFLGKGANHCF